MYTKNDVFNIRNSDYELTAVDEKMYEAGWILHQADKTLVMYKQHDSSILNQNTITITIHGDIKAEYNFMNKYEDYDTEEIDMPENVKELVKEKYTEMIHGYWKP